MIERNWPLDRLHLRHPVAEIKAVSHDPSLQHQLELTDGRHLTAVQLQWEFLEHARKFAAVEGVDDADNREVLELWEQVLAGLDSDPAGLADRLDWVAKLRILDGYRDRDRLEWSAPQLELVDLQYADVRPEKGLYHRLVAGGRMRTLFDDAAIDHAVSTAPEDTRAWFRGECMRRFAPQIAAASWDSIVFDVPGRTALTRIPTLDPYRGTRHHVQQLLDTARSVEELVDALAGS
jgi:proteasome accessory factor A